jgi:hypothetical protein
VFQDGAVLVFLPGWKDISTLHDMLKKNPFFSSGMLPAVFCLFFSQLCYSVTYFATLTFFRLFREISRVAFTLSHANRKPTSGKL